MDNKIEHFFVLKPNGKIGWIEKMPEEPKYALACSGVSRTYLDRRNAAIRVRYNEALQSAIDNAVEVSNQEGVKSAIRWGDKKYVDIGVPFSLQCSVEKKENLGLYDQTTGSWNNDGCKKTVALVTFSQSEREETQEERKIDLWNKVIELLMFCEADGTVVNGYRSQEIINQLRDITRKTP